jgi:general stress protein YciG
VNRGQQPRARTRSGETSKGGQAVKAKYGPEFFREIGRKGGQAIKDRGLDYLREIGRLGGEATKARHGAAHYAEIGRKGGQHGKGQPKPGAGRTRHPRQLPA